MTSKETGTMAREDVQMIQFGKSLRPDQRQPKQDKTKVKKKLEAQVSAFLAKGGEITKIPNGESGMDKGRSNLLSPKAKKAVENLPVVDAA